MAANDPAFPVDFNEYYAARPTEAEMEKTISVDVVAKRCVYVNDFRIVGGEPYFTENLPTHSLRTATREVLAAFSDGCLKAALRERKARKEYMARWHAHNAAALSASEGEGVA